MKQAILLLLIFIFCTASVFPQSENSTLSLKETGIDQYKLALLFAKKGNWERANHWFRQATFLAFETENTQVPNVLGKMQYQLAQMFWEKSLFQYADYWFQESAVQTYAALIPRWRKPRRIAPPSLVPQARPYYMGKSLVLPLNRTLYLQNEIGSVSLNAVQLGRQGEKAITGTLTNHGLLQIKKLRLKAYLYNELGKVLKINPSDGYASTTLTDLETDQPQRFHLKLFMHETFDQVTMVSFAMGEIQHEDSFYLTEGHAARHPILVYGFYATFPDELESVSLVAKWINTGKREIKAISFQVEPYTAMGLKKVKGKIRHQSQVWLTQSGKFPFGHNTEGYRWKNVWYNNTIVCIKLNAIKVEFEDRQVLRIDQRKHPKMRPAHFFYKNTYPTCPYEE